MQIVVSGKHIEVGDALRSHITQRLDEGVHKYMDRVMSVHAVVSKEKQHLFRVDIAGNVGTHDGMVVKSSAMADDVYAAFEQAATKIEKQLRRYKRRLTNHHADKVGLAEAAAMPVKGIKYVIADHEEEAHDEKDAPLVIAEKPTDIEHLTVSQAVMRMDLSDLPALMFINSAHGRVNVVYRRQDGNISWVDPVSDATTAAA